MARSHTCHRTSHKCCYVLDMALLLFDMYPMNWVIGDQCNSTVYFIIIIIIIIIGSTALNGSWRPQTNIASDLYPGQPTASFYNPVSLRHSLPRQSILISVGHVLVDLQGCLLYLFRQFLSIHSPKMPRPPQSTGF